jgi:hypothetical protein
LKQLDVGLRLISAEMSRPADATEFSAPRRCDVRAVVPLCDRSVGQPHGCAAQRLLLLGLIATAKLLGLDVIAEQQSAVTGDFWCNEHQAGDPACVDRAGLVLAHG